MSRASKQFYRVTYNMKYVGNEYSGEFYYQTWKKCKDAIEDKYFEIFPGADPGIVKFTYSRSDFHFKEIKVGSKNKNLLNMKNNLVFAYVDELPFEV